MRRRVVLPALVAGAVLTPVAAYGFWTVGSSGVSGSTRANALAAPSVTTSVLNGAVRIAVTAPPATGPRPTTYLVNRTAPTAAPGVCTITAAADGTGFCTDSAPVIGQTNTYQVVGRYLSWSALGTAVLSSSVDVAALTTNITATAAATATAGTSLNLTVTARTAAGIADVTFTGTRTVLVTGAPTSPNGTAPTIPVTANFVLGVATVPVTLVKAGSTTLTVSAAGFSANTAAITVAPATAATYALTGPATAQAGVAYTLTSVTALDAYGNTATGHTGAKVLTWSGAGAAPLGGATPTVSSSPTFTAGVATNVALTLVKAETVQLKATTGTVTTPTALPVTVSGGVPAAAAWSSITSAVPGVGNINCSGTNCTALALGNNGGIAGTISLTDAYGNPAANAGSGWSMTFLATKTKGQGTGDFTVNGGTPANPVTYPIPTNGSSSVTFSYAHPGTADWRDILTITLFRNGTQVSSLTATLDKT